MPFRRLTFGVPLTALLLFVPACDDGSDDDGADGGETGEAPFDEDMGPPTEEMQELMPDGELPLQWVFADGQWVSGWRIADATTGDEQTRPATSEVYLFCADSEYDACPMMTPPRGDNVFPTIPRDDEYSPYWQVVKVRVPDDYVPDSIKSVETIIASGYEVEALPMIVNCPIHGLTATLEGDGDSGFVKTPSARAWYEGHRVYYWDFGFLPYADGGTEVVTSASSAPGERHEFVLNEQGLPAIGETPSPITETA